MSSESIIIYYTNINIFVFCIFTYVNCTLCTFNSVIVKVRDLRLIFIMCELRLALLVIIEPFHTKPLQTINIKLLHTIKGKVNGSVKVITV